MVTLAVGVISSTRTNVYTANNNDTPIANFDMLVYQADSDLNNLRSDQKLIVVPEYMLSKRFKINEGERSETTIPELVTKSEKKSLYNTLKQISSSLGDVILVAGTIFYRRKILKRGLNVCPVLRNGQIIHRHYKDFDDGDLGKNITNATFATKPTSPKFTVDGIRYAVDICGDLGDNHARERNWGLVENTQSVDVHITIADGAGVTTADIHARANGYFIYTDITSGKVRVMHSASGDWQNKTVGGKPADIPPVSTSACLSGMATVQTFSLPL
jgi:hypothetical protein